MTKRLYLVSMDVAGYVMADSQQDALRYASDIASEVYLADHASATLVRREDAIDGGWELNSLVYGTKDDTTLRSAMEAIPPTPPVLATVTIDCGKPKDKDLPLGYIFNAPCADKSKLETWMITSERMAQSTTVNPQEFYWACCVSDRRRAQRPFHVSDLVELGVLP